jgi:hypothetical protein
LRLALSKEPSRVGISPPYLSETNGEQYVKPAGILGKKNKTKKKQIKK